MSDSRILRVAAGRRADQALLESLRALGEPGWCCCFVAGSPALVIAYHGPRQRLFALALRDQGTLLQPLAN